ncbi:hypothetical protein P1T46_05120 [Streptococcus parauberis]|nr:hypothetical protein P1T46_05120 [Streptococcus parauberis]
MITTHEKIGVGYFDTVFAKIEIETMADALKSFALNYDLDETSSQGEVLNYGSVAKFENQTRPF